MGLKLGTSDPTALYVGSSAVLRLCLGAVEVWSATPIDSTYAFNSAEDYPLGDYLARSGSGKSADGSSHFDYYNMGLNGINSISDEHPITGSKSFKFSSNGQTVSSYNAWIDNTSHAVPEYLSAQFYVTQLTTTTIVMQMRNAANGAMCAVQFDKASGKIRLLGNGGTVLATSAASVPLNTAFRVELGLLVAGTATGHAVLRYFADPFGTAPTEVLDVNNVNTNTGVPGRDIFGIFNQVAGDTMWLDNMQKSNQDWPPVPTP